VPWGPVRFIFEYGPPSVAADFEKSPALQYEDPAKKSRSYVEVMASKAPPADRKPKTDADKKPADAEKKPKADAEKKPSVEKS